MPRVRGVSCAQRGDAMTYILFLAALAALLAIWLVAIWHDDDSIPQDVWRRDVKTKGKK